MAEVGESAQNGYAERVIRTIKEEEVYLNEYADLEDARKQIGRFIDDVYQKKRIHSSLGYLTPAEFEAAWKTQTKTKQKIRRSNQPRIASAAAAESLVRKSKALPVPKRNKDFKERSEFFKKNEESVSSSMGPLQGE